MKSPMFLDESSVLMLQYIRNERIIFEKIIQSKKKVEGSNIKIVVFINALNFIKHFLRKLI